MKTMLTGLRAAAIFVLALLAPLGHQALAATAVNTPARDAEDLAVFERKATLSKELGATHMVVTEGLPLATWEFDKNDPYPSWFMHHASLLKIFPPKGVAPHVNAAYASHVADVVGRRCTVLRRLGLKAVWNANEPTVMPEAFFAAYPQLRGPRIDQPSRSTKPHFAINVDEPQSLAMYRETMQLLLKTCPEVDLFNWVTTDAGSGFDWSPALYPGSNGAAKWRDRPMADRVAGFMINAQQAAKDAGHDIEININPIAPRQWMIPTFSPDTLQNIIRKLPRGLAVQGQEGPDGRTFAGGRGGGGGGAFTPVVGLVAPPLTAQGGGRAGGRVLIGLGDATTMDFNYRLLKATQAAPGRTLTERMATLRAFAVTEVGEAQADNLVEVWAALNDAQRTLSVLDFGAMLRFGHVLNRWVSRPMTPFPEELTADEKRDWRPYLFQAKGEEQASNLIDIQAMRMYDGWGAKMLFQRDIELTIPRVERAMTLVRGLETAAQTDQARSYWNLTGKRLQALIYLLQSADNMVAYQAQLDRVKALKATPEKNPVLAVQSSWDRTDLMETARKEIDTMVALEQLLASTDEPILDLAPTPQEETIMRLGPNLRAQIRHKIEIMNAHWRDYDRLFTIPNP